MKNTAIALDAIKEFGGCLQYLKRILEMNSVLVVFSQKMVQRCSTASQCMLSADYSLIFIYRYISCGIIMWLICTRNYVDAINNVMDKYSILLIFPRSTEPIEYIWSLFGWLIQQGISAKIHTVCYIESFCRTRKVNDLAQGKKSRTHSYASNTNSLWKWPKRHTQSYASPHDR